MNTLSHAPLWGQNAAGLIARLVVVTIVLVLLASRFGEAAVRCLLPLLRHVFEAVAADFRLLQFDIDQQGGDRVLRATVMWKHIQVVGGKVIYPDPRGTANASTLLAHVVQGPLTAAIVLFAWPARWVAGTRWLEWGLRALIAVPLLVVIVVFDLPLVLAGELWEMVLQALDPESFSLLAAWKSFMQGGGRYALGAALGACTVLWAQALIVRFHQSRESSAPHEPIASVRRG